jgi:SAM-dependent methyltransferase
MTDVGASPRYEEVMRELRAAYATSAADRDRRVKEPWKVDERAIFLERLKREGKTRLLEIGAGTGQDGAFFVEQGLEVVVTDLSPEMVALCREKGLDAYVMDFLHLDFPSESFDAVFAVNCLLHVPNADLPSVLKVVHDLLVPGGLLFLGVYGGQAQEGIAEDDWHDPPRFFSRRTDEQIRVFVQKDFEIVDFRVVRPDDLHFQSLTLRSRHHSPLRDGRHGVE